MAENIPCPQNDVLAAVLLANKETRDIVLPLIEKIESLRPLKWIESSHTKSIIDTELELLEDELSFHIHSLLMKWDSTRQVYFPILAKKFSDSFARSGEVGKKYLQNSIKEIIEWVPGESELFRTAKELVWDSDTNILKNIANAAQRTQDKLIHDFVYTKGTFKVKGWEEELIKSLNKMIKDINSWRSNKISKNPIYKIYSESNGVEWAVKNALVYDSLINWGTYGDIKKSISSLLKKSEVKWGSLKKTNFNGIKTWRGLQERIISNLDNIKTEADFNFVLEKISVFKSASDDFYTSLISKYNTEAGINKTLTDAEKVEILKTQWVDYLITYLRNKVPSLHISRKHIDEMMNIALKKKNVDKAWEYIEKNLKKWNKVSEDLDKRWVKQYLYAFVTNYYNSVNVWGIQWDNLWLLKSLLTNGYNIWSTDNILFYDPRWMNLVSNQDYLELTAGVYNRYTLELGPISSASTKEELDELLATGKYDTIVVPKTDLANHHTINEVINKYDNIQSVSVFWKEDASLFVKDGKLTVGTPNWQIMMDMKKNAVRDGNIVDFLDWWTDTAMQANEKIIKYLYPDNIEDIYKIIEDTVWDKKTIKDLWSYMNSISYANRNIRPDIVDLDASRKALDKFDLEDMMNTLSEWTGREKVEVDFDEDMRGLLFDAIYLKDPKNLKENLTNLAKAIWTDLDSVALKKLDTRLWDNQYADFVANLHSKWLWFPYQADKVDEFIRLVQEWGDYRNTDFWQVLSIKNSQISDLESKVLESITESRKLPSTDLWVEMRYVFNPARYQIDMSNVSEITKSLKKKRTWIGAEITKIHAQVGDVISQYKRDVESLIKNLDEGDEVPRKDMFELHNKLRRTLQDLESQYDNTLGTINRTYTFDIPSISVKNPQDIEVFNTGIDELNYRYQTQLWENIAAASGKPGEAILEYGMATFKENGKVMTVWIDDYISRLIKNMPEEINLDSLLRADYRRLNLESKRRLVKTLETVKINYITDWGLVRSILWAIDPSIKFVLDNYNPVRVAITTADGAKEVIVPNLLKNGNLSDAQTADGALVLSQDEDLLIKSNLFKKVTDWLIGKWDEDFTPNNLMKVVQDEINSMKWEKKGAWVIFDTSIYDRYFEAFVPYTRMWAIPADAWQIARQIVPAKNPDLSDIQDLLDNITYSKIRVNDDWMPVMENLPLSQAMNSNLDYFPDVLYREVDYPYEMSAIKEVDVNVNKADIEMNIKNAVDNYENGFYKEAEFTDGLNEVFRNTASPILSKYARTQNLKSNINNLVTSWLNASKVFNSLLNAKWLANGAKSFFGIGKSYDPAFVAQIADRYKQMMAMTNEELIRLSKNKLSEVDNASLMLALYYKKLKKVFSNMTTDNLFNETIARQVDSILDNLTQTKPNWKDIEWKSGWESHLFNIIDSLKNQNIFYGIDEFSKRGIGYKYENWWAFGYGSTFFDSDESVKEFNRLFNSNFSKWEYRTIMGSLNWTSQINKRTAWLLPQARQSIWRLSNSPFVRLLASFPGSFIAGIPSAVWYLGSMRGFQKQLWANANNYDWMTAFRNELGILRDSSPDFTNLIDMKDVDAWDLSSLSNTFSRQLQKHKWAWWALLWQGIDNGQNVTDAIFGAAVKNYAMKMALYREWFSSLEDFKSFIDDVDIDADFKRMTIQSVVNKTYDSHEAMINYSGRSMTRNVDNGSITSKIAWLTSFFTNPISFRSGLGNNMVINTAEAIVRTIKYAQQFRFNSDGLTRLAQQIANDPVVSQMLIGWVHDIALALKMQKLNREWESVNDRELSTEDFFAALSLLSQQAQFFEMSGPIRVLKSWLDSEGNFAYGVLSQYAREMWRQLGTVSDWLWVAATWLRIWVGTGDWESANANASAQFKQVLQKLSMRWVNYQVWETSYILPIDTWLPPMFQGSNKYQENYYSKDAAGKMVRLENLMKEYRETGRFNTSNFFDLTSDIFMTNRSIAQLIRLTRPVASFIAEEDVEKELRANEYIKNFEDNNYRYKFTALSLTQYMDLSWEDKVKYEKEVDAIIKQMSSNTVPGSKNFQQEIESFLLNGTTVYTDWDYTSYNNEERVKIFTKMKEDGILDIYLNKMKSSQDNLATQQWITKHYTDYIDNNMRMELVNYDEIIAKEQLGLLLYEEVEKTKSAFNKEMKVVTWDKKRKSEEADVIYLKWQFIDRYWNEYQNIASNENWVSWWGLKVANNLAAEELEIPKVVLEYNDDGSVRWIKPKYSNMIENIYKTEMALSEGRLAPEVMMNFGGIMDVYPESWKEWDKTVYDQSATLAKLMHNVKFVNGQNNLPKETKDYLNVQMFGRMGKWAIDLKKVSEMMWEDFAEEVRRTTYQTHKLATNMMAAMLDADKNNEKWNGRWKWKWKWKSSSRSRWLSDNLSLNNIATAIKNTKNIIDTNKLEFYKPMVKNAKLELYNINERTKKEMSIKPPEAPIFSSQSVDLFKNKKLNTRKPRKLEQIKTKTLSKKKLTWQS